MFPRLDPKIYPIQDDRQFFLELLQETRVMLVQGTGFNWPQPDHFRIVFLPHEDDLREAIGRIAPFLDSYRKRHSADARHAQVRRRAGARPVRLGGPCLAQGLFFEQPTGSWCATTRAPAAPPATRPRAWSRPCPCC